MITGGASGLGRCVAEVYALKGATVAVLDIMPVGAASAIEGVKYYECDVGDVAEVEGAWAKITKEVHYLVVLQLVTSAEFRSTARHTNCLDQLRSYCTWQANASDEQWRYPAVRFPYYHC